MEREVVRSIDLPHTSYLQRRSVRLLRSHQTTPDDGARRRASGAMFAPAGGCLRKFAGAPSNASSDSTSRSREASPSQACAMNAARSGEGRSFAAS